MRLITNWHVTYTSLRHKAHLLQAAKWHKHQLISQLATHDASKRLVTVVRFLSLLPWPADQSSSTLKSVHWNRRKPIFPEQPVLQTSIPARPIKVPAEIVVSLQKAVPLLQAMRWVKRTYKQINNIVYVWWLICMHTILHTTYTCRN